MIIVWLAKAITNRDALIDHIALENLQAAIDQDNQIELHMIPLKDNPEIGRIGRKQGTRELVLSKTSFILIYRIRPRAKRIEILRVLQSMI